MSRPRSLPTDLGVCRRHGLTDVVRHRSGFDRAGKQRYILRCLACHNAYQKERAAHGSSPISAVIPTCPQPDCSRPMGHPDAETSCHQSVDNVSSRT